jgi:Tol biopolymer transport system component
VATDERLRQELERAGRPADPTGVYEELIRRKERRRIAQRLQAAGLVVVVVLGTVGGLFGLSRVFRVGEPGGSIASASNGLLAVSLYRDSDGSLVIATMRPDGSDLLPLSNGDAHDVGAAWSPDGTRIAFWRSSVGETAGIWIMNADGSAGYVVHETDASIGTIAWSPDGERIAFVNREIPKEPWTELDLSEDLFVMDTDGSQVTPLITLGQVTDFAWSPDGTRLVIERQFGIDSDRLGYDLFLVDADGANEVRLTHDGASRDPTWSPDGSRIVFVRGRAGDNRATDLFSIAPDGSGLVQITHDPGREEHPTWAPDGSELAYARYSGEKGTRCELVVAAPDGSGELVIGDEWSLGGCPLFQSWQAAPASETVVPTPSPRPTPSPSPSPPSSDDLGLGFPVCNVSSIGGTFTESMVHATVFVATRIGDTGECRPPEEAFNVVALDLDGDDIADTSYGPIECTYECRTFSAPDIDGDGTDELLVLQQGSAVVGLRPYDVVFTDGMPAIVPLVAAEPADPSGGFEPGQQPMLLLGGDGFGLETLRCGDLPEPDGPGIIATSAESLPHDSPDSEWHAHEVTLVLRTDGLLHVVDVRDFTEPVTNDPGGPSFASGETLCGSNLGP